MALDIRVSVFEAGRLPIGGGKAIFYLGVCRFIGGPVKAEGTAA